MSSATEQNGRGRGYHLAAVVLVAAFLAFRLIDVGGNPKGFFCDEASIGYNAASVVQTARDEHGEFMPLYFKAFGEYKAALYIYATALSVKILGLTHFATRLPAAVFLALAMLMAYAFLARRVHPGCGLLAVLLLGIDPWLHHFSHVAFELTTVPFLIVLSLVCWYEAVAGRRVFVVLAALSFCATFYAYPPARLFVPLMAAGLLIIYCDRFFSTREGRRDLLLFISTALVGAVPFVYYLLARPDFSSRLAYLNIFTTLYIRKAGSYGWLASLFESAGHPIDLGDGTPARLLVGIVNYLSYWSPDYLLLHGDSNLRFGSQAFGVLSYVTCTGLVVGLALLVVRRQPLDQALLWWMLIYPIPGALTWEDVPHSGRGIVGFIGMAMIAAIGFWQGATFLIGRKRGVAAVTSIAVLGLLAYGYFACAYFSSYARDYSRAAGGWMQYGYATMMDDIRLRHEGFASVRIVTTFLHYEPYIFALFYSGMDPHEWQRHHVLPWRIEDDNRVPGPNDYREHVLYVFAPIPQPTPPGLRLLDVGNWEDGTPAFGLFEFTAPSQ